MKTEINYRELYKSERKKNGEFWSYAITIEQHGEQCKQLIISHEKSKRKLESAAKLYQKELVKAENRIKELEEQVEEDLVKGIKELEERVESMDDLTDFEKQDLMDIAELNALSNEGLVDTYGNLLISQEEYDAWRLKNGYENPGIRES